jgi:long-chain acyl-CoA synthetase
VAATDPFEVIDTEVRGRPLKVFAGFQSTLDQRLDQSAQLGDRDYIVVGDRRISFAAHRRIVEAVARALHERYGVGRGDRVVIAASNSAEWIIAFWATVRLGGVAVALNAWWAGPELDFAIALTEPALIIADHERAARIDNGVHTAAVVDIERDFAELERYESGEPLAPATVDLDDAAIILFTSGTSGRPKGVVHTHRNVEAYLGMIFYDGVRRASASPARDELSLCQFVTNPLFHVSGLHGAAIALLVAGVKSVWHVGRFDAGRALAAIEHDRCTGWAFVPTTAWRLVNHPQAMTYDLACVRNIGGGGAPVSAELLRRLRVVFPNAAHSLGVGYGLTESTALMTLIAGDELVTHPGTVGRPLPLVELEIRDDVGVALPVGTEGEIVTRGSMVMAGYWRDPVATAAAIDPDGWLRTGDLGSLDADGYLQLVSRRTDLVIRGGENVYPAEVEQCLEPHPAVAEVAVVGLPHEDLGQEVAAIVVLKPGDALDTAELTAWLRTRIAYFKIPTRWLVSNEPLPRTATGKVVRELARARFER